MTPKVVYDTNVVVSAALKPGSLPASLVALAIQKQVRLFLSPAIVEEYTEVLKRPTFPFDPKMVETFLRDLKRAAVVVHPTTRVTATPHSREGGMEGNPAHLRGAFRKEGGPHDG